MATTSKAAVILALALVSQAALGCVLGAVYNLPIPFETYAAGAAGALVASFAIVAYVQRTPFTASDVAIAAGARDEAATWRVPDGLVNAASALSVVALLLTIATGFVGSANPLANFNMTFFWIVFTLGLTYLTAVIGDVYAWANPWRTLCRLAERFDPTLFRGAVRYPANLGYYPALALYMALIWIELFGSIRPATLSSILIAYAALNVAMAWLFGKVAWFRYGELFSVFFRLIGLIAPVQYLSTTAGIEDRYLLRIRKPFLPLLETHAEHASLLLFVLFMLSSTAFDGAHETLPWVTMFWQGIYPVISSLVAEPYSFWVRIYYAWQTAMLVLSPFAYLALYLALLWMAKLLTKSDLSLRALALRFAFTLVPIALVYNVAHYFGELLSQGLLIIRMASDPFNAGWDLFGTSRWLTMPVVLDAGIVWHTQVAVILAGHIVSVYLAHIEALKVFPSRGRAILSQVPLLALMVLLTTLGLWILSLPIDAGVTAAPPDAGGLASDPMRRLG
jgi:hypothetical protein